MGKEDAHRATICKDTDFVRYEQTRKGRFVWILFCLVQHFLLLTNVVGKKFVNVLVFRIISDLFRVIFVPFQFVIVLF